MISPDLSRLINLRQLDVDPWSIAQAAVARQRVVLSDEGYDPLETDPDAVLLEGIAAEVALLNVAANRAPWAADIGFLNALGVPWNQGVSATTTALVTGDNGTIIPAGLILQTADPNLSAQSSWEVVSAVTLAGPTTVTLRAAKPGIWAHRLPSGTPMTLTSSSRVISEVHMTARPSGGIEPETPDEYYVRVGTRLGRLTDSVVTPNAYTLAALGTPGVLRALTTETHATRTVTVHACGPGGEALAEGDAEDLQVWLADAGVVGVTVEVVPVVVLDIDVTMTVRRKSTYDSVTVEAAVETALASFLDPDLWPWGQAVEPSALVDWVLGAVAGVASISLPSVVPQSTVLIERTQLVTLGTAAITVLAPE